jgi:hypothetical protein
MVSPLTDLLRSRPAAAAGGGDVLPNYWNAQRLEPSIILPSTWQDVRPTAGIGAWGAWKLVNPGLAQDVVLTAVHFNIVTTASMSCWVQVGYDPVGDGSYTPIETVGIHAFISGAGAAPLHGKTARLAPFKVPANKSIGIRAWKTAGDTRVSAFLSAILPTATWYDPWPNAYIAGGRVSAQRRYPVVPAWQTSAVTPTWTQVYAAAPNAMLLTAAEWDPANGGGANGEVIEVGVGAAGSEVIAARVGIPTMIILNWSFGYQEFGRKALIVAGERVAVRHNHTPASANVALYFEDL